MVRSSSDDSYGGNFQSDDSLSMLEEKIDSLIQSNQQILRIVRSLEYKMNLTMESDNDNMENEQRSIDPRSTVVDLMDDLETKNLLNKIHQFIVDTNSRPKQSSGLLDDNEIEVIRNFASAIETEQRIPFTQNLATQVSF